MLFQERLSTDQLADLCQLIQTGKPAYTQLCSFFKELFLLQESALRTCRPPAISLDAQRGAAQRRAELPLIQRERLAVDWPCACGLFEQLCTLAQGANEQLARTAETMIAHRQAGKLDVESCCALLLGQNPLAFEQAAAALAVEADILAFFIYHSVWPSAAIHLHALKEHLPADEEWHKGYCPFCGSQAMLSLLATEGQRYLVCAFCRHEWAAPRLFCPSCENQDTKTLSYFFSEAEPEYRVNTCQACKGYIKTLDLRQLSRPLYPPLEAIITTHLDLNAQEHGYHNTAPAWLRI